MKNKTTQRARLAAAAPVSVSPPANLYAAMAELAESLADPNAGDRRAGLVAVRAVAPRPSD